MRPAVAACLDKDLAQRPTPQSLLDALAPQTAPQPTPDTAGHPPTLAASAVPPAPAPASGAAVAPTDGDAAAATVTAAPLAAPDRETTSASFRRSRPGWVTAGVAGTLIVLGGTGYGLYTVGFPKATYELTTPDTMAEGAYRRDTEGTNFTDPQPDDWRQRDVTHHSATYAGTGRVPEFQKVEVYGSSGRFRFPEQRRDALISAMTETGSESVIEPFRMIGVPGADVEFRCGTVDQVTVCGWGDDNTTVAIAFTPAGSLELAAAETRKIRDDLRGPIGAGRRTE